MSTSILRKIQKENELFSWQKVALLLEKNSPARVNGAIFNSFYLKRVVQEKKLFSSRAGSIV